MLLEISSYNNRYTIKGTLNRLSLSTFDQHFSTVFDKLNVVIIDIENVENIDRSGVMALAKLHNEALKKGKKLSIIGFGCKELYDHFKSDDTAA